MVKELSLVFCFLFFFLACESPTYKPVAVESVPIAVDTVKDFINGDSLPVNNIEKVMRSFGLVDIKTVDSTIQVKLKYSTQDNFLGFDVYGDLNRAYLQPDVAEDLKMAQDALRNISSGYSLLVLDAARPLFVQQAMWDTIKKPVSEKVKFLSNPKGGSLHNYGAAVDITIVDSTGKELDMGTPYDFEGEEAYPIAEREMIKSGRLTLVQVDNRKLLRQVMAYAGFFNIQTEWWHFNACFRSEAKAKYKIIP